MHVVNKNVPPVKPVDGNLNIMQALRGLFCLVVIITHVTINSIEHLHRDFLFNVSLFGSAAVDFFFVVSGFMITYTSIKNAGRPDKLKIFYRRRLVKIFPIYWIIITFFLVGQLLFRSFYNTPFKFTLSNVLSTYFLLPGHTMVNGVSWTLTFELYFYLLFSLFFLVRKKEWIYKGFAIYTIAIVSFGIAGFDANENVWIKLILSPVNIEIYLGMLAGAIVSKIKVQYSFYILGVGAFLLTVSAILTNNGYHLFLNDFNRLLLFGVPSFFIILGVSTYETNYYVGANKTLLLLGDASYSLYLLHLPFVAAFVKLYPIINIQNDWVYHILWFFLILLVCLLSVKVYQMVELPLIKKLNSQLSPRRVNSIETINKI